MQNNLLQNSAVIIKSKYLFIKFSFYNLMLQYINIDPKFYVIFLYYIKGINMDNKTKYKIDETLIKVCKDKNLNIRIIIKSTTQFIKTLDMYIDQNIEKLLNQIIDDYKDYTNKKLLYKYKNVYIKTTDNQKLSYQKIGKENRVKLLNEIISISINNKDYNYNLYKFKSIKYHNTINRYTLNFFLNKEYQKENIKDMELLLLMHNRILTKQALVSTNYAYIIKQLFEFYKIDQNLLNVIDSCNVAKFIYNELGKIYFVMNIKYNMSLKNKSKNLRMWKSNWEKVLINKYNYNIENFINNEIHFMPNLSKQEEYKYYMDFHNEILYPELEINYIFDNDLI